VHHFLSDHERRLFYLFEWSDIVVDIREQFPLLDLDKLMSIASDMGFKYPTDPVSGTPYVLTTDFNLATLDLQIYERRLRQEFLSFYGNEFLEALGRDVSYKNKNLFNILRLDLEVFDPVMHLLMIRFLSDSPSTFFARKSKYKPFGKGPWLCLNPACEHYLHFVVTKLEMLLNSDIDSTYSYITDPRGTFECDCGFKYSKSGVNLTEDDKFRFERIVTFGQLWEQKYWELNVEERRNFQHTAYTLSFNDGRSPMNMLRQLEALWKSVNDSV
jgi:hypothetical protein